MTSDTHSVLLLGNNLFLDRDGRSILRIVGRDCKHLFSGLDIYGEAAQPSDNSIRYESYSGNRSENENS